MMEQAEESGGIQDVLGKTETCYLIQMEGKGVARKRR